MNVATQRLQLVRLGALSGIDRTLVDFGIDPKPVLAEFGLTSAMLADGDLLISATDIIDLIERAANTSGRPHFALDLAERQDLSMLGSLGLLFQTATTLRDAALSIERYSRTIHARPVDWRLGQRGHFDTLELYLTYPLFTPKQARLAIEMSLGQAYRVLRLVAGGRFRIERICLVESDNSSVAMLRRFFSAPVETGAEFDGLVFAAGAIDVRIAHADPKVHESVRRFVNAQQHSNMADSLCDEVRKFIRTLLPTGQCSIERIARCYACDKRTLQRYLKNESDTTYQELLDDVRFEVATRYLRDPDVPMTQLAALSGFSDPSNFARAFRQRFGQSPRDWRKQHGSGRRRRNRIMRSAV